MLKDGLKREELRFTCPKCGADISKALIYWGCGWDKDYVSVCPKCKYDGYLNTMTGTDPDGTFYQQIFDEDED